MNSKLPPHHKHTRVGIVGAGYIAPWHCQALNKLGHEIAGVADPNPTMRSQLAQAFSIPVQANSLDHLLSQTSLDSVHILVPPSLHAALGESALKTGLDVFLEKPMATETASCQRLLSVATEYRRRLGVNHNFLFFGKYLELKRDLRRGLFGQVDQITLAWNKPLGQLQSGPWNIWMFETPTNIALEILPHSIATVMDLGYTPTDISLRLGDPLTLPTGQVFYRRWRVLYECGRTEVELIFSFRAGFPEHFLRLRGSHGVGHVDFEDNLYTSSRSTEYMMLDVDRFVRLRRNARAVQRQASQQLAAYGASKVNRRFEGNAYGASIRQSIAEFYADGEIDSGISAGFGCAVMEQCERVRALADQEIADRSKQQGLTSTTSVELSEERAESDNDFVSHATSATATEQAADVLVLGGTGFIGKKLVEELADRGHHVRVLARQPSHHPSLNRPGVQVMKGNMLSQEDMTRALRGTKCVYHLARSHGNTWQSYYAFDVDLTKKVALLALEAGVEQFVYAGTIDSYFAGQPGHVITEQTELDPHIRSRNLYALAKATAEVELRQLHQTRGLPLVIVRPGIVVGSGGNPFHWGVGFWNQSTVRFWGYGNNPLPFVLVEEVASGMASIASLPDGLAGQSFNLVGDYELTAREYVRELQQASGVHISQFATPIWKHYAGDLLKWSIKMATRHPHVRFPSYRDWQSRTQLSRFDCNHAKTVLGWQPHADRQSLVERGIQLPVAQFVQGA